jgi:hypothetical protein
MNSPFAHPKFTHAFRDQLNMARAADPEIRAAVNLAMKWINDNNAEKPLYQSLSLATKTTPVAGASGQTIMCLFPALAGQGHHAGIIMGPDAKGHLRSWVSNEISQPVKEATAAKSPAPKNIDAFNALKSTAAQRDLIQLAVNAACADQLDLVEQVCAESQRFLTTAGFVVILSADKPLLFVTPLVVYGPAQTNPAHAFTGKVTLP